MRVSVTKLSRFLKRAQNIFRTAYRVTGLSDLMEFSEHGGVDARIPKMSLWFVFNSPFLSTN